MTSTSTLTTRPAPAATDSTTWLRVAQLSVVLVVPALVILAVVGSLFTTIDSGDFRYTADYWYTAVGLPITLGGIGLALAVHRLQDGADGRLGTVGVWINTIALIELFVQLLASVIAGSELRWGPTYPLCTLLSFIGIALLAAGSWRTGVLPRWMLGVWPLVWVVGSLFAQGPTPLLLAAFLVLLVVTLGRRVSPSAG